MKKHFSNEEIESFMKLHAERYPDAVQRMQFVMQHPFEDNKKNTSRTLREIGETARLLEFFNRYTEVEPDALHYLTREVLGRVADGLRLSAVRNTEN
jgi:hypothetical protein